MIWHVVDDRFVGNGGIVTRFRLERIKHFYSECAAVGEVYVCGMRIPKFATVSSVWQASKNA